MTGVQTCALPISPGTNTNKPYYYSAGGPNNGPRVNFAGAAATTVTSANAYMTCSLLCSASMPGGMTAFYYLSDTAAKPFTRLFVANGYCADFAGGGQFNGTLASVSDSSYWIPTQSTYITYTTGTWVTVCHRIYNSSKTQMTQDLYLNGVLQYTKTNTGQVSDATFTRFGQSENGDTLNEPYWAGDLYALLLYARKLETEEIQEIDRQMRNNLV